MYDVLSAGGNYGYIAKNIATIYYIIEHSQNSSLFTEEQKLYATALIDCYGYLENGIFSIYDLTRAVQYSQAGIICVDLYHQMNSPFTDFSDNRDLVNLTMQLEALIFRGMGADAHTCVDSVISKKAKIEKMIRKTLSDAPNGEMFHKVFPFVTKSLADDAFKEMVLSYQEECQN